MDEILKQVQLGNMDIAEAKKRLATYEDLGFAKVDHHRTKRQGFPETIFGEGKTAEQITAIITSIQENGDSILVTRISKEKAIDVQKNHPTLIYNELAELLHTEITSQEKPTTNYIAILCAGTSDLKVAEEAAVTAEVFGCEVRRFYDVGVAGIHRLLDHIEEIQQATVSITVAGMEGALPSVVGGLVSHPIVAVPTSVGYGANFKGLSALLTMLNSCASGISVVNIDNGYGAAYNAALIYCIAEQQVKE